MKELAKDTKLVVRPVIGTLVHSHFWEGPCRAGRYEDMQPEREREDAKGLFHYCTERLKSLSDEVALLEAIHMEQLEQLERMVFQ